MIKPKLHRFLTTGMFNLIVKDPRRLPPERAALDQGIHSLESHASSNLLRCFQLISTQSVESLSFTRIY
jgi:hypothetical protein